MFKDPIFGFVSDQCVLSNDWEAKSCASVILAFLIIEMRQYCDGFGFHLVAVFGDILALTKFELFSGLTSFQKISAVSEDLFKI